MLMLLAAVFQISDLRYAAVGVRLLRVYRMCAFQLFLWTGLFHWGPGYGLVHSGLMWILPVSGLVYGLSASAVLLSFRFLRPTEETLPALGIEKLQMCHPARSIECKS